MAKRKCRHSLVVYVDHEGTKWNCSVAVFELSMAAGDVFSAKCQLCGAQLSLWPSNDELVEVRVEIRAAEIAACEGDRMSEVEAQSYGAHPFDTRHPVLSGERGDIDHAGWLASEIDSHHDIETRDHDAWSWSVEQPIAGQYEIARHISESPFGADDGDCSAYSTSMDNPADAFETARQERHAAEIAADTTTPMCAACEAPFGCDPGQCVMPAASAETALSAALADANAVLEKAETAVKEMVVAYAELASSDEAADFDLQASSSLTDIPAHVVQLLSDDADDSGKVIAFGADGAAVALLDTVPDGATDRRFDDSEEESDE